MSIKQLPLLASIVVVFAALAGPSSASAFQITHEGEPVEDLVVENSGTVTWSSLGTGVECMVDQSITANGETTQVTELEVTPETCVGFGFVYANCEVESVTSTSMPLPVNVEEDGVAFSEELDFTFSGPSCLLQSSKTVTTTVQHPTKLNDQTAKLWRLRKETVSTTVCTLKPKSGEAFEIEGSAEGVLDLVGSESETYEIG